MSSAANIAIKVSEIQDEIATFKAHYSYILGALEHLPKKEKQLAIPLEISLKETIEGLKQFLSSNEVKETAITVQPPETTIAVNVDAMKTEIQATFMSRKWFPKTLKEFIANPFNVNVGILADEVEVEDQCPIHPLSLFSQAWNSFYLIVLLIFAILFPIYLSYGYMYQGLIPLSILHFLLVGFDTFLLLKTGITVENELEMCSRDVLKYHLKKGNIQFNIITCLPYVFIAEGFASMGYSRLYLRLICLINCLAFPRAMITPRVSFISQKFTQFVQLHEINTAMVNTMYIVFGMIFYWHWFACACFFLVETNILPDFYPFMKLADIYVVHLFEGAAITFTAAWGAVPPVATHDRLSKMANMLFSAFLLALFSANITTFMVRLDSSGRQFSEKIEEVNQYILYKGLGRDIQKRIIQYYHFKYSKGKYFDEKKILHELSEPLRVTIAMRECKPLITRVPFFKGAEQSFITQVVTILKVCHFLPDDIIIEEGNTGDTMYFIESGNVEVKVGSKSVAILGPGQYFGEISLLFGHMKRTATIVSITSCVLYSLAQSDLEVVLELNPQMAVKLKETAEERLRENNVGVMLVETTHSSTRRPSAMFVDHTYTQNPHQSFIRRNSELRFAAPNDRDDRGSLQHHGSNRNSLGPLTSNHMLKQATPSQSNIKKSSEISASSVSKGSKESGMDGDQTASVLEKIETEDIKVMMKDTRRRSSVLNFIGMQFIDEHAEQPQQPFDSTLLTIQNQDGTTDKIEVFKPRKQSLFLQMALPENSVFIPEEPAEHLESGDLPDGEKPIVGTPEEAMVVPAPEEAAQPEEVAPAPEAEPAAVPVAPPTDVSIVVTEETPSDIPKREGSKSSQLKKDEEDDDEDMAVPRKKLLSPPTPNLDASDSKSDADLRKPMNRKVIKTDAPPMEAQVLTMEQKIRKMWNKYQPSTSYCPLHPSLLFSRIWNSIVFVAYLIVALLLPLPFGFESLRDWLPAITVFMTTISILDFAIKLQTGYAYYEEVLMEPKQLIEMYSSNGEFFFDFLAGMPWVFIVDAATPPNSTTRYWARLISLLHGMGFIRALLNSRRSWLSEKVTELVRKYDINSSAVQAIKILFAIVVYWHWHSCAANYLVLMGTVPNQAPSLINFDAYSLHFWTAATEMLNAGCGAVPPVVTLDRWLKVFNMICNASLVALFVGNISSFMIGLDSSGRNFNEQLEQVSQYVTYKGLGRELKRKILDYYQLKYSRGKYFDEEQILSELNHPLRLAIYMKECRALIVQVPFFKGADNGFISQVVMILKPAHFLKDDLVIEKGTAGDFMFFIASGNLDVLVENKIVAQLTPGQFFGEIAVLFGHMKRTASIRATSNCRLYSLSRTDLNLVLEVYPEMAEKLQKTAEERINTDLQRRLKIVAETKAAKPDMDESMDDLR